MNSSSESSLSEFDKRLSHCMLTCLYQGPGYAEDSSYKHKITLVNDIEGVAMVCHINTSL